MVKERSDEATAPRKRHYEKPQLEEYGELRDLTAGGTGATVEGPSSAKTKRP